MKRILNILGGGLLVFTAINSSVAVEDRRNTANLPHNKIKDIVNIEMISGVYPIVSGKVNNVEEIISDNDVGKLHLRKLPGYKTLASNDNTIAELALENTLRLQLIPFRNLWTEVLQIGKDMKVENEKLAKYGLKYDYGSNALYDSKTERQFTFAEQQNLSENYPEIESEIEKIRSLYERRFNVTYDMNQVGSFCGRFCDDYGMGSLVQVYQLSKGHLLNDDVWAGDWENIEDPVIWTLPFFTPQIRISNNLKKGSIQEVSGINDILNFSIEASTTSEQLEACIQLYAQRITNKFNGNELELLKWLNEKFSSNYMLAGKKNCRNEMMRIVSAWRKYNLNRDAASLAEFLVHTYKFMVTGTKLRGRAQVEYQIGTNVMSQYLKRHHIQRLYNHPFPTANSVKKYLNDTENLTSILLEKYMVASNNDDNAPLLPQSVGKVSDFMLNLLQKCEELSKDYSVFSAKHQKARQEFEIFLNSQPVPPQYLVINLLKNPIMNTKLIKDYIVFMEKEDYFNCLADFSRKRPTPTNEQLNDLLQAYAGSLLLMHDVKNAKEFSKLMKEYGLDYSISEALIAYDCQVNNLYLSKLIEAIHILTTKCRIFQDVLTFDSLNYRLSLLIAKKYFENHVISDGINGKKLIIDLRTVNDVLAEKNLLVIPDNGAFSPQKVIDLILGIQRASQPQFQIVEQLPMSEDISQSNENMPSCIIEQPQCDRNLASTGENVLLIEGTQQPGEKQEIEEMLQLDKGQHILEDGIRLEDEYRLNENCEQDSDIQRQEELSTSFSVKPEVGKKEENRHVATSRWTMDDVANGRVKLRPIGRDKERNEVHQNAESSSVLAIMKAVIERRSFIKNSTDDTDSSDSSDDSDSW